MFKSVPYPVHVLKSDAKRAERAMAYARQSVVHPDGTRFASFFAHFKAFQIISDRGKILHTVDLPITPFAARYDKQSKMRFYGYISNPSATSDRIYVLCAATEEEPNYDVAARQVHVFDWDGHPVACYTLDHDVHHIAVDGRTIYAVNMFKSNQIYVYRF